MDLPLRCPRSTCRLWPPRSHRLARRADSPYGQQRTSAESSHERYHTNRSSGAKQSKETMTTEAGRDGVLRPPHWLRLDRHLRNPHSISQGRQFTSGKRMRSTTVRYLALLRGVNNIGATRRVAMADLRVLFERLGFRDVRTLLNSGNVIFSAPNKGHNNVLSQIDRGLATKLRLTSPVTLLSGREVAKAVSQNPFAKIATNPSNLLVVVPRNRSDLRQLRSLLKEGWAPEALAIGSRVAYVWCANGIPRSPLWAAVDRALKRTGTVRNMATM